MHKIIGLLSALATGVAAATAHAETRVALVIGNSNYANVARLSNPARDASAIAVALRSTGFKDVTLDLDLDRNATAAALKKFAAAARSADVAIVYYAGHGIEIGGMNYLVPVDAKLATDADVGFEAIPLDLVMTSVEGAHHLHLVVLDACRNNPFAARMHSTGATRAVTRGLAPIEPAGNTLVVYAAKGGTTALDGDAGNSPFATALARDITVPGLEIGKLFRQVRDDVMTATKGQQEPFVYGSLSASDFYFVPPVGGGAPAAATRVPAPMDSKAIEASYWSSIASSSDVADFRSYLAQYPSGAFASLARNRIAALTRPAQPVAASNGAANVQTASLPLQYQVPGYTAASPVATAYRNAASNFALTLPARWTAQESMGPNGMQTMLMSPNYAQERSNCTITVTAISAISRYTQPDLNTRIARGELKDRIRQEFASVDPNSTVDAESVVQVGDLTGQKAEVTLVTQGVRMHVKDVIVMIPGTSYAISCGALSNTYASAAPDFDAILGSFRVGSN